MWGVCLWSILTPCVHICVLRVSLMSVSCVCVCVCRGGAGGARARAGRVSEARSAAAPSCPRFCWEWWEVRLEAAAQGPLDTESMFVEEGKRERREERGGEPGAGRKK